MLGKNVRKIKQRYKRNKQRHKIELGGQPSDYWIHLYLFLVIFKYPDPKEGGEGKRLLYFFTLIQDTNKILTILIPQTPINHTLDQDILLVAII